MMTEDQKKLVESNIKLAYDYVYKYGSSFGHDFDDSVQIASLGLCNAALTFDASKGYAFSTYAYKCMSNEFLKIARAKKAKRRDGSEISFDEEVRSSSGEYIGTYSEIIPSKLDVENEIVTKETLRWAVNNMSGASKKVIQYYIDNPDTTQVACAKHLNIAQATVSRAFTKLKKLYYSD